jgi:hypothetical protein
MFFCKNCGTKIENDSAKFCPKCGQKFEQKQTSAQLSAPNPNVLKNANASPSPVQTPEHNVNLVKNNEGAGIGAESSIQNGAKEGISPKNPSGNNLSSSATPKAPKMPHQDDGKKGKGLLIAIIVLAIILIGIGGTVFYLFKTGKLKKIEKKIYKVLHIKTKNQSEKHKHKHHGKSSKKNKNKKKNKKNKKNSKNISNSSNPANSSNVSNSATSAPTYVYANNNNSNRSNQAGGFSAFKTYLSSASPNIVGISPLGSAAGNAPAVIISNVMADSVSASPGSTINIHSKFYAETPPNPSSQSVKLTYEVYGNGLTAYNNSYVNVDKPGIYNVNLAVKIPSNFPAGTYTYVLTVTSTATIEESPAAYIKVQ